MKQRNQARTETLQQACGRLEDITAAAIADLRRRLGEDPSRAELEQMAETVKQMEAQLSSLKRALT